MPEITVEGAPGTLTRALNRHFAGIWSESREPGCPVFLYREAQSSGTSAPNAPSFLEEIERLRSEELPILTGPDCRTPHQTAEVGCFR